MDGFMADRSYRTVDIERRGYGRRYTWLPVDHLSRDGLLIDLTGAFMRPELYDLRPGDIVRWREGERLVEAQIVQVERTPTAVRATFEGAHPLPPDAFFP
jgi:hypothetical protein